VRLSQVALGVAARVPTLARLGVRLWAETYWWKPRKEHWFFLALRSRLQLRLRRRDRLLTGQQIYADVEGAELLVLQGAAQTSAHCRPHLVLEFSIHTERFGYTREALYHQLLDWGYRVFSLEAMPLRPYELLTDDSIYCNVLAVETRRLQTLMSQDVIDLSRADRESVRSSAP
jgi:hypothetical protein